MRIIKQKIYIKNNQYPPLKYTTIKNFFYILKKKSKKNKNNFFNFFNEL